MQTDSKGNGRRGLTSFNQNAIQDVGNDSILTQRMRGGNKKSLMSQGIRLRFSCFQTMHFCITTRQILDGMRQCNPLLCPDLLTRIVCAYWQGFCGRPCINFDYISLPKTKMLPFNVLDRKPLVIKNRGTTGLD